MKSLQSTGEGSETEEGAELGETVCPCGKVTQYWPLIGQCDSNSCSYWPGVRGDRGVYDPVRHLQRLDARRVRQVRDIALWET